MKDQDGQIQDGQIDEEDGEYEKDRAGDFPPGLFAFSLLMPAFLALAASDCRFIAGGLPVSLARGFGLPVGFALSLLGDVERDFFQCLPHR